MAKSQRSKREKRLRTIRREITTPYYDKQESAKLAAQEAALAAPKIPPKIYSNNNKSTSMEITSSASAATNTITNTMDIDMNEGGTSYDQKSGSLKPIGRKLKKKLKIGKGKRGKGKIRRKSV